MYVEQKSDPLSEFMYGLKATETKRQWPRRLKMFFDFLKIEGNPDHQAKYFVNKAREDPQWAQDSFIRYVSFQNCRVKAGKISPSTVPNYFKPAKLFCEMNEISLNWKKIRRGLPTARQAANDRAPTVEEIQKLTEYPDRRIKPIVYTMISSGIRIGAWDYLRWKHVIPIPDDSGQVLAAKIIVYDGEPEQYYSFITPAAYQSLKDWMDFRQSYGEKITSESWLMRDIWQTTNVNYKSKSGLATCPKKLKSSGIKRLIERALWEQGLRQPLENWSRRHEWQAAHGLRKFYNSTAELFMKWINVEITMGHKTGVSASYYRPLEKNVLQDYLKAVNALTIDADTMMLQKQFVELEERSKDNEYILKAKLQESNTEIQTLKSQMTSVLEVLKLTKSKDGKLGMNRTALDSKRRVAFRYVEDDDQIVDIKIPIDSVEIQ
jgi:hypothetical protein